jgi:hypothetical protein
MYVLYNISRLRLHKVAGFFIALRPFKPEVNVICDDNKFAAFKSLLTNILSTQSQKLQLTVI